MKIKDIIKNYLAMDADDIVRAIDRSEPRIQQPLLKESIRAGLSSELDLLSRSRALLLAQSLLSLGVPFDRSREDIQDVEVLLNQAEATRDPRLKRQMLSVGAKLGLQLGREITKLDRQCVESLEKLAVSDSIAKSLLSTYRRFANASSKSLRKKKFQLPSLNFDLAKQNVLQDVQQDWYRDPWDWPELRSLQPLQVTDSLGQGGCGWTFALDVAKMRGDFRPALVMNPVDRVAFQCLADELSLAACYRLPPWVFGWRPKRVMPQKGHYEDNSKEWKSFKKQIRANSEKFDFVLKVDVGNFFSSVDTQFLLSSLGTRFKKMEVLHRLDAYFEAFQSRKNGKGLPQRCLGSSVLAHACLQQVDQFLSKMAEQPGRDRVAPVRWMDDIWLFGNRERVLREICVDIEAALEFQGLSLNSTKTQLVECDEEDSDILADVSSMQDDESREKFVQELLNSIKEIGEAPRSDIAFILKYKGMSEGEIGTEVEESLTNSTLAELSHAADRVADFIRERGGWRQRVDWYKDLVDKNPDPHSWLAPTWARMFPEHYETSSELKDLSKFFDDRLGEGIQDSLVPISTHRLIRWSGPYAKDRIVEFATSLDERNDPFVVRAAALALFDAGLPKREIGLFIHDVSDASREALLGLLEGSL